LSVLDFDSASGDGPDASETLRLAVVVRDEVVVLRVIGEVDLATAPELQDALIVAEYAALPMVVVDLTRTTFLSVAGMRALLAAEQGMGGNRFAVASEPSVRRTLCLAGLEQKLPVFESVDAAVDALLNSAR
jgi:anti-sigma B factor antagonist